MDGMTVYRINRTDFHQFSPVHDGFQSEMNRFSSRSE
jgi:hypothetical protein